MMKPPLWRVTYRRRGDRWPVYRYLLDEGQARRLFEELRSRGHLLSLEMGRVR